MIIFCKKFKLFHKIKFCFRPEFCLKPSCSNASKYMLLCCYVVIYNICLLMGRKDYPGRGVNAKKRKIR